MPSERKRGPGVPRGLAPFTPRPGSPNRGFASEDPERQRESADDQPPPQGGPQPARELPPLAAQRRPGRGGQTGGGGTG